MEVLRKPVLKMTLALTIAIGPAARCLAIDYQPFDWTPLPPGTDVVMGYYEYGKHNAYNNAVTGTTADNTHLESNVGIFRYLHYSTHFVAEHPWDFNLMVPFGRLSDGRIGGYRLGNASGIADPIVSAGFWLIDKPQQGRWVSVADYITLPIGDYDKHKTLNLGGNRWVNDLQADFTQVLLDKWTIDISADWIYYADNTGAGRGNQRLSQKDSFGAWAWLTYDLSVPVRALIPSSSNASISAGYMGSFGGVEKLDGVETGAKAGERQIRLTYMMFLNQNWQGLLSLNHDVSVSGGFKQEFGLVLRIAKLF